MDVTAQVFWQPKAGSSESEYEDAFFPRRLRRRKKTPLRFAIADGATETSFSGIWARLLVSAFVAEKIGLNLTAEEIYPLQQRWRYHVAQKPLPWYAEEKLAYGAFSSLLGLELDEELTGTEPQQFWRAAAVGDSCLVQIRDDIVLTSLPLDSSASFNSRPTLLSSLPSAVRESSEITQYAGTYQCNDMFLLMTDALSSWFFREKEEGRMPWRILRDLDTEGQPTFSAWIDGLRSSALIKNDDVTLIRIDVLT